MIPSLILAALALLVVFWAVGAYRRLSRQRKQCKAAFARLQAQLQHRHELMPHLIEAAGAAVKDGRDLLEAVGAADKDAAAACAEAGRKTLDAAAMTRMVTAESALDDALRTMLAQTQVSTADTPDMRQLAQELSEVDTGIGFARQVYNDVATQYNVARTQFPGSVIAIVFAFTPVALLQQAGAQPANPA